METKKIKVYLGIPSMGDRVDAQVYALFYAKEKYKDKLELVMPDACVHRTFHDYARNEIIKDFLKTDCDVLWFLDSDVVPHQGVLDFIANDYDKWEVAGAPCPIWMPPKQAEHNQIIWNVYKMKDIGFIPASVPPSGQEIVHGMGTGCMFIKREVFNKINEPHFAFTFDEKTRERTWGEDLYFCKKLYQAGVHILVDYEKVCKHYKMVCLLDVNNYAIMCVRKAYESWEKSLKDKMASLMIKRRLEL